MEIENTPLYKCFAATFDWNFKIIFALDLHVENKDPVKFATSLIE